MAELQVLICTYGQSGLKRLARIRRPQVEGVEYLVALQLPDSTPISVPDELKRSDIRIFNHRSKGLSRNRNFILGKATAPLILISDDDLIYTPANLRNIIGSFRRNSDADILTFDHTSQGRNKKDFSEEFDLSKPPVGYYLTSFELAMRRESLPAGIRFNEHFGVNAIFPAGEEELFLHDLLAAGLKGRYIPVAIAEHPDATTGERRNGTPEFIAGKGAVFLHLHPATWPLRMIREALRRASSTSFAAYIRYWMQGVRKARELKVF